jgi:hypothetical protein
MQTIYSKADHLANEVTSLWAAAVGRGINYLEEFSLLVEWHGAIKAAQELAVSSRDWIAVEQFDAMLGECELWLSLN